MQGLYAFSQTQLLAFAVVLIRISAFVVVWPVFSVFNVPHHVKILFALTVASVLFPLIGWRQIAADLNSNELMWLVMREVFVGISLGFITRGFFYAVSSAGELISIAMGLSSASILNPAIASQGTAIEQIKTVLATLIFLGINGHHLFLKGLVQSYETVPLSNVGLSFFRTEFLAQFLQSITLSSLQLAFPIMVAILILNLTMGFVGRAVPQLNVLVMSLPITILGGLVILIVCLPLFNEQLVHIFGNMTGELFSALKEW